MARAGDDFTIQWVGLDDWTEIMRKFARDFPTQKKIHLKALWVAAQPVVRDAKTRYKALGGSGALGQATAAYRWKRAQAPLKHVIHVGPKRSNHTAVRKWIFHYRRRVKPRTFEYGVRHGHLIEFGFRHVRSRRNIPGQKILAAAKRSSGNKVPIRYAQQLEEVARKMVASEVKRRRKRDARKAGRRAAR